MEPTVCMWEGLQAACGRGWQAAPVRPQSLADFLSLICEQCLSTVVIMIQCIKQARWVCGVCEGWVVESVNVGWQWTGFALAGLMRRVALLLQRKREQYWPESSLLSLNEWCSQHCSCVPTLHGYQMWSVVLGNERARFPKLCPQPSSQLARTIRPKPRAWTPQLSQRQLVRNGGWLQDRNISAALHQLLSLVHYCPCLSNGK